MGIDLDLTQAAGWQAALAALDWQRELGVSEVIGDDPVDAYALPDDPPWRNRQASAPRPAAAPAAAATATAPPDDPVAAARAAARAARTLPDLRAALAAYDHCDLKKGARSLVFSDGLPGARVLILGEAPGREEDLEGRPFVGRAGQLLDRMFAAIGLSRTALAPSNALYITNVSPWRPPANRDPSPEEIAMFRPFVERHIELADPQVIVVMGNTPLFALLNQRGILKARGTWARALDRPVMPMTHPAYLLRNAIAKREAWADLLEIRAVLEKGR
ncbi:MAG: uracil-DNA glycosylase [Paracoccaceae bacterium]|nr:MAG: uracil-DNA glycosylase [Paracoccaceae bacterium]